MNHMQALKTVNDNCDRCNGTGVWLCRTEIVFEIQRCDGCKALNSDLEAFKKIEKLIYLKSGSK